MASNSFLFRNVLEKTNIRISDWNGHMRSGSYWHSDSYPKNAEQREADLLRALRVPSSWGEDERIEKLISALETGKPLDEFVPLEPSYHRELICRFCGKYLRFETNGVVLRVSGEPCIYPNGLDYIDTELNVPSGRILVWDDLRTWYPSDHKEVDTEQLSGLIETTLAYAKINLATGFVGNSPLGVYRNKNVITIGEKERTRKNRSNLAQSDDWGRKKASISTHFWWYCVADLEDFEERLKHFTPNLISEDWQKEFCENIIKTKPGVYRVRWFTEPQRTNKGVRYAELNWLRAADPKIDHLGRHKNIRLTALECCIQSAIDWPTLYLPLRHEDGDYEDRLSWEELNDEQKLYAIARAANRFMCVLGGDEEWHENGHILMKVDEKTKEFAAQISADGMVPIFDKKQYWSPFHRGYGGLCLGAGIVDTEKEINFNLTFASLALNIVRNYLKYPPKPDLNRLVWPPAYHVEGVRNRMKLALQAYRNIRKKYQVDPPDAEFDALVMSTDYENIIETCDLGPNHPPESEWGPNPKALSSVETVGSAGSTGNR